MTKDYSGLKRYIEKYFFNKINDDLSITDYTSLENLDEILFKCSAPSEALSAIILPCPSDLERSLLQIDESFTETLFRIIREKGISEVECYKKAGIDRKLFSKIRSNSDYKPSKDTVIALAIALSLDYYNTQDFLEKAGFTLSHSSKRDIIIEYYINKGIFDLNEINEALLAFDQKLLGNYS